MGDAALAMRHERDIDAYLNGSVQSLDWCIAGTKIATDVSQQTNYFVTKGNFPCSFLEITSF